MNGWQRDRWQMDGWTENREMMAERCCQVDGWIHGWFSVWQKYTYVWVGGQDGRHVNEHTAHISFFLWLTLCLPS